MSKLHLSCAAFLVASSLIPSHAAAQNVTWDDVVEANLRRLESSWACPDYVYNSARNVEIVDYNTAEEAYVVSATYDYRCKDSRSSDKIYMTFRHGVRTCVAYAFWGRRCTLFGQTAN